MKDIKKGDTLYALQYEYGTTKIGEPYRVNWLGLNGGIWFAGDDGGLVKKPREWFSTTPPVSKDSKSKTEWVVIKSILDGFTTGNKYEVLDKTDLLVYLMDNRCNRRWINKWHLQDVVSKEESKGEEDFDKWLVDQIELRDQREILAVAYAEDAFPNANPHTAPFSTTGERYEDVKEAFQKGWDKAMEFVAKERLKG